MLQQPTQVTLQKRPQVSPAEGQIPSAPVPLDLAFLTRVSGGAGEVTAPGRGW
jgi:hypothetical protein